MSEFFYRPRDAWAADFIPFYKDGVYHLFYLLDWRDKKNHGEGTPWYHISTKDFIHFKEYGETLPRGGVDDQDLYVYTGSVFEALGQYHIYYTGHNPHLREKGLPEQGVMHAVSDDLVHFIKVPEDTFFAPPDVYEPHDWRDPFVFFHEETNEYWMLLAARIKDAPEIRKGCTALCVSKDLKHWEVREPIWAPSLYFTHECPDLFRMGDWWYLVFSEFTDRCVTRYRMSRSLQGPWLAPENDAFDGRAYYAAKTASDGEKRFVFGWNPTKDDNNDNNGWMWGGNLVVHEVYQKSDGALGCRIPQTVKNIFTTPWRPLSFQNNSSTEDTMIRLSAEDKANTSLSVEALPDVYRFDVTVRFKENTRRLGIMLHADDERDNAYCYFLEPHKNRLAFDFWPNHPWGRINTRSCDRFIKIYPNTDYQLTILVDHTICVAYFNDEVALNGRMYSDGNRKLGLVVCDGEAEFKNPAIWTL